MRILQKACESSANPLRILCESSGLLLAATSFSGTRWSNIDANPMRILSESLRILWSSPRSNLFSTAIVVPGVLEQPFELVDKHAHFYYD